MFEKKELPPAAYCPLLQKECIKDACKFWIHIRGTHPQTAAEVDYPDCAVRWLPVLLLENSKETRQAAAAIESSRNEQRTNVAALASLVLGKPVTVEQLDKTKALKGG